MKKVVIIGGGFSGSLAAQELENDFDVTLIDTKDYFEYTPGILRTIADPAHIKKVQVLHSHYLPRSNLIRGKVTEVSKKFVFVGSKKFSFDYLIISSGSTYGLPIKDQRVVMASRASNLRKYAKRLEHAQRVLIIGGGIVGVELAAEIITHFPHKHVSLIHSHSSLMNHNNLQTSKYAYKYLSRRGVELILKKRIDPKHLPKWATSEKYDLVFACTGITPNFEFMKKHFAKKIVDKKILSDNCLRLRGVPNIFVSGDVSSLPEEKTAQNAEAHAFAIVSNIRALENGVLCEPYKPKIRPMVISLGAWNGVFEYKKFVLKGVLPGILKHVIEWKVMRTKRPRRL